MTAVAAGSGDCVVLDGLGVVHAWGADGEQQVSEADGFSSVIQITAAGSNIGLVYLDAIVDCFGDFDGDGEVGGADLTRLLADWGGGSGTTDLNEDGIVGGADLTILIAGWGDC